jgi:hypothetical protein
MRLRVALFLLIAPIATARSQDYHPSPVELPEATLNGKLRVPRGIVVTEFAKMPGGEGAGDCT